MFYRRKDIPRELLQGQGISQCAICNAYVSAFSLKHATSFDDRLPVLWSAPFALYVCICKACLQKRKGSGQLFEMIASKLSVFLDNEMKYHAAQQRKERCNWISLVLSVIPLWIKNLYR